MTSRLLTLTLAAMLLLASASAGLARDLAGTLSLETELKLVLELKEGFFSELLRSTGIRSRPRAKIDLTALGNAGDRLFIGTDFGLYCEKLTESGYKPDQIFKIGTAVQLWSVSLAKGVRLAEVQSALGQFVGDTGTRLKVEFSDAPKKPTDVERASIRFWLDEIVYQFDNPARRKGKVDNYAVIVRAIQDALPEQALDQQKRFDNFKVLTGFIREAKDSNLVPFRDLLRQKIARIKDRVGRGELSQEKASPILKGFDDLQAEVARRTEDL
jgi:hypothetical protein